MPKKEPDVTLPLPVDARLICALRVIATQHKTRWHYIDHLLQDGWVKPKEKEWIWYHDLTDKAKDVLDEAPADVQCEATAWQLREVSEGMWKVLERLARGRDIPSRRGTSQTLSALNDRGLITAPHLPSLTFEGHRLLAARVGNPVFHRHVGDIAHTTHLPPQRKGK